MTPSIGRGFSDQIELQSSTGKRVTGSKLIANRADVSSRILQPGLHLFDGDFLRIVFDPIDFAGPQPAFFHIDDAWPPFQGGCSHIVSNHHEGDMGGAR
jgi:hypothetical protein